MTHDTFNFNIYEIKFFGQYWKAKETKAIVVLVHGMGEHSTRYVHVAKELTSNNYSVITFDHFGHGKTAGKRGHNPNFEAVLESISKTIAKAKELFPNKPIFLYGHSMGGNAVINYTLKKQHSLKGVVATSPFLKLAFQPPKWKLFMGKLLQRIAPFITLGNELDANHISRDKNEVEKYENDSLVHDKISPNFSITFIKTGKWAIKNAHQLKVPMFILHGTEDKIIDYKGSVEFAKNTKNATLKLFENGYHELHNDLCREKMLADIVNWLNSEL
ncbi:alpha/beta hydrolase [Polaribacter cellanae]|uniref:Monoacylglycerol lipase n=1 Tax=Polaribacter cellanae TaxID=2818493 RepID=A0A975H611_9FLAO|nr:alpha/beta hydrolase [Polaribacter cellanae]QTE21976.1 lysophospholipase [Polaribacter cellanae]